MGFMKKETKNKGRIVSTSSDENVDVIYENYDDGTSGFVLNFKNLKLKEKLEQAAKEAGLTPGGYLLASLFYKDEKTLKEIVDRHSLKDQSKK